MSHFFLLLWNHDATVEDRADRSDNIYRGNGDGDADGDGDGEYNDDDEHERDFHYDEHDACDAHIGTQTLADETPACK